MISACRNIEKHRCFYELRNVKTGKAVAVVPGYFEMVFDSDGNFCLRWVTPGMVYTAPKSMAVELVATDLDHRPLYVFDTTRMFSDDKVIIS